MHNVIHLRLLVALLDRQNNVKGICQVEGQPRFALRKAAEQAVALCSMHKVAEPRLVIVPAGHGSLAAATARAIDFAKAGLALDGMEQHLVHEMGRRAAFVAFCGQCAESVRFDRAKAVQGERIG